MKKMYWRPQGMSVRVLLLLAAICAGAFTVVEVYRVRQRQPLYKEKRAAATLTERAFRAIKKERIRLGIPVDAESDPSQSGLIGALITPVTTNSGHLPAKQTSINANFSAVIVHMLGQLEIKPGATVAAGLSGSFPALNVAVLMAMQTLKLRPLVISSTGSSQWGANYPLFTWPDMERTLANDGILRFRSIAVAPGGIDDRAFGLSADGLQQIGAAMNRSGVQRLDPTGYMDSLEKRMALYEQHAGDEEIAAYINVGGGTTSVGTSIGKRLFRPGINRRRPRGSADIDSVMTRFTSRGIPVIHISKIDKLAARYGLPPHPLTSPPVGQGDVFERETYNKWLALASLIIIMVALVAFLRLDLGYRLLSTGPSETDGSRPEPMV